MSVKIDPIYIEHLSYIDANAIIVGKWLHEPRENLHTSLGSVPGRSDRIEFDKLISINDVFFDP